jgi:D-galactarolactone cycloisomerase
MAPIQGRFHKFVAMNSYDTAPKGHTYEGTLLRIQTDQGVEGIGPGSSDPAAIEALKLLLGADPMAVYQLEAGRIINRSPRYSTVLARFRFLDGALFDLIGKLTGNPAWKLIGSSARDRVEVYDGTLYFSDIWFKDRGVHAVVEEAQEAKSSGYRGLKLKLGRGWKWMEKDAGLQRDIEVVHAVRQAVGTQMKVMVDPNNGYRDDRERAWKLMAETAGAHLYWMEEIFPEAVADYTWLREKMAQAGIKTLIADGESQRDIMAFEPFLKPVRLIDVLQLDIRVGGFLDNRALAQTAASAGAECVPHNWASQLGGLMGLQISKAVGNIPGAEDDRSTCDVIVSRGYERRDGSYTVPDKPGLSIGVDEEVYARKSKPREIVLS